MSLSRHVTVGSGLLVFVLGLLPLSAQQAVPAAIFETWIWNSQRQKIDPKLGVYRCYVEVLDDLGGGRVRMRDYRIRPDGQVVKLGRIEASIHLGLPAQDPPARSLALDAEQQRLELDDGAEGERCRRRPLGLSRAAFSAAHPPRTL